MLNIDNSTLRYMCRGLHYARTECDDHQDKVIFCCLTHRKAAVRLRLAFPNWKLGVGRVVPPASHASTTPFLPLPASRSLSTKSGLGSI